jgi:hypothetical protein
MWKTDCSCGVINCHSHADDEYLVIWKPVIDRFPEEVFQMVMRHSYVLWGLGLPLGPHNLMICSITNRLSPSASAFGHVSILHITSSSLCSSLHLEDWKFHFSFRGWVPWNG